VRKSLIALFALVVALVGFQPAAGAASACGGRNLSNPFQRWGDQADYFLIANGGFEAGNASWTFAKGGAVKSGSNEPWFAAGQGDSHDLLLRAGSSATAATFCVGAGENLLRLFVKRPGVRGAKLRLSATMRRDSASSILIVTTMMDLDGSVAGWAPSPVFIMPAVFGTSGTEYITLKVAPVGTAATWEVDDIYVDPYRCC
jgi:hypothetical protein